MSLSPPIRRLSIASSNSKREEDLINAYEAEEEKIINLLSRKLEKLREEKIELENTLEAESEQQVNRLNREISALRTAQVAGNGGENEPPPHGRGLSNGNGPSMEVVLEALRRENEALRSRLTDAERDYIRMTRLNEIYREELIDHRRRLGLPVDNLIGIPTVESQPTHRRSWSSMSSSASSIMNLLPQAPVPRPPHGVPIPPSTQAHRPVNQVSESSTPQSHSPSSAESQFLLSPGFASVNTQLTTPPSSSFASQVNTVHPRAISALSYPLVPPPSLSSSFGSPTAFHPPRRDHSVSPVSFGRQNINRRGSFERARYDRRMNDNARNGSHSRKESIERGARVAETGSLIRGATGPSGLTLAAGLQSVLDNGHGHAEPQV